mmetsp:Transcript_23911/g.50386  ORF Transcript_23911/g.50386 Transcript_23911/m.50386 type:complete len:902 (-) Transcript_23911:52-2757(-)
MSGESNHGSYSNPSASQVLNDEDLRSRLDIIRQFVARPIPKQPFEDSSPALIPFQHDEESHAEGVWGGGILIGSARHAANIPLLKSMNVAAVLNCASGGIARLPVDELKGVGIRYCFTNCRQDSYSYPILHEKIKPSGKDQLGESIICSKHLEVSNALFADIRRQNAIHRSNGDQSRVGNVLFFCVAGQNRSATLAAATLMLHGTKLEIVLKHCSKQRPFVLENVGFQQQLIELEAILNKLNTHGISHAFREQFSSHWKQLQYANSVSFPHKRVRMMGEDVGQEIFIPSPLTPSARTKSEMDVLAGLKVEIELLIPGLCTMEVRIPVQCTILEVKKCLIQHANDNLLRHDTQPAKVAKGWIVLAMFGFDDMYDIPLEVEAVELKVQLERMNSMFGLKSEIVDGEPRVTWNEKCRFALVIFSVVRLQKALSATSPSHRGDVMEVDNDNQTDLSLSPNQEPWTFEHKERPNAPATLLQNTLHSTHLRAWDFVTGEALASKIPTVFSFADDARDRRAFMMVSRSANTLQQFDAPGEGDILGMGENAIVHRVQLSHTTPSGAHRDDGWTSVNVGLQGNKISGDSPASNGYTVNNQPGEDWDAAVKRPFSLSKMLVFLHNSSEAGLAKRLRLANALNSDGRVLYFYGLGLGLSTNAYNLNQYKFELTLLSKYEEEFSTYTMRRFIEEYVAAPSSVEDEDRRFAIQKMQLEFSITNVKVILVSLLNAFRDLTLMGIQAFDFNHLNNVLVSRDFRNVRLIDIDGNAQGSVHYPQLESFTQGQFSPRMAVPPPQKPCLDVDLNVLLPSVIEQLILGKGRSKSFVSNTRSEIWRAKEEDGKEIIQKILLDNFYPSTHEEGADDEVKAKSLKHTAKVAEWFYSLLKKKSPWTNWTNDIYDAMRCIDHLPIS